VAVLDCVRYNRWGMDFDFFRLIFKFSSHPLLESSTSTRIINLNTTAMKAIRTHLHSHILSLSPSRITSYILSIYDAFATSNPSSSHELCGICADTIPAKSLSHGSCSNRHLFRMSSMSICLIYRTLLDYVIDAQYAIFVFLSDMSTKDVR
jgi:hypothetical protein